MTSAFDLIPDSTRTSLEVRFVPTAEVERCTSIALKFRMGTSPERGGEAATFVDRIVAASQGEAQPGAVQICTPTRSIQKKQIGQNRNRKKWKSRNHRISKFKSKIERSEN
jgi:hypothetical protein